MPTNKILYAQNTNKDIIEKIWERLLQLEKQNEILQEEVKNLKQSLSKEPLFNQREDK